MPATVSEDQLAWRGPAAGKRSRSLLGTLFGFIVPPKGERAVPTGAGMLVILIGLCLGLAAYNTGSNILFSALALLLAAIVVSGFFCWINFMSARWRLETSSTFRVGEEGEIAVVVENSRRRFPLFCLFFDIESEEAEASNRLFLQDSLNPGESKRLVWKFRPEKRCLTNIELVDVISNYPFGFLRKHIAGACSREAKIWPSRIDYSRQKANGGGMAWQGQSTKSKGMTGELIGLRDYAQGDPPRSIHWKVSARQGRFVVKQNAAESQSRYSIHVDPSPYLWKNGDTFEHMCSLAVSLAEDLFLEGKLEKCSTNGGNSIKINRVADLESFFDDIASLNFGAEVVSDNEFNPKSTITFAPLEGHAVGAFINGSKFAQT